MKKAALCLNFCLVLLLAACSTATAVNPTDIVPSATALAATQAPTIAPTEEPTAQPTEAAGIAVSFANIHLVLPEGVAAGVSGEQFPRADSPDLPEWMRTPGHTVLSLEEYPLQGTSYQPQIYLYRAQDYAELYRIAFESIRRLENIHGSNGATIPDDELPAVPFFNNQQVYAANIEQTTFQNGFGVRFLSQNAQYAAPANNYELVYQFQGVTSDGAYYIVAILPVAAPGLAETPEAAAAGSVGGVAYPNINDANPDWDGYYTAVQAWLNAADPQAFTPTLTQLDALIQSIRVAP